MSIQRMTALAAPKTQNHPPASATGASRIPGSFAHPGGQLCAAAAVLAAVVGFRAVSAPPAAPDAFAFFRPTVVVAADERRRLDQGEAVARVLPSHEHQVGFFAAVPVNVDGDRLVAWMRDIADLKKSSYVKAISRFSDPPRLEDLGSLTLDDVDLNNIPNCRPGSCGVKLTGPEIAELQRAIAGREDWKPALQEAFRRLVFERVQLYLAKGYVEPSQQTFSSILGQSPFLTGVPGFAEYLDQYPRVSMPGVESFLYWSKEQVSGKPVVSVTHVSIVRGGRDDGIPEVLVAGQQIFATHYMNGSLALTALLRGPAGSPSYLTYLNRSDVDLVGGLFGGLVRFFLERRLRTEGSNVLQGLRRRLESGEPDQQRPDAPPSAATPTPTPKRTDPDSPEVRVKAARLMRPHAITGL